MLFNSKIFIFLFLPITLIGYYGCNKFKKETAGMAWLILMSFLFYGYFKPIYLPILVGSILFNYAVSSFLLKLGKQNIRKLLLILGVGANISVLGLFKYEGFLKDIVNGIFATDFQPLGLLMPLGISFFTFQQISYVVDSYRKEMKCYSLIEYAAYVFFFPQLVAGPIVLHTELIPQFLDKTKKSFSQEWFAKGLYSFALGLGKKVLLADTLGLVVNAGFADVTTLDTTNTLITMFAYTFQIYFDFSGYCDMALGLGYMFHIDLPNNFNSPYKAKSVNEFWKRWHMTLTRFLTKYCYIPLGGNRKGKLVEYRNVLIVFALSGLWHGANWTFVLWGVMHGVVMVLERICGKILEKIPKAMRYMGTFLFLSVSWMYFRADSVKQANYMVRNLLLFDFGPVKEEIYSVVLNLEEMVFFQLALGDKANLFAIISIFAGLALLFVACLFMKNTQDKIARFKPTVGKAIITVVLLLYSVVSLTGASIFLYFNF